MSMFAAAMNAPAMVLANFEWNIFLRGILFPSIMFVILCGSSYMILATNMGNRLGFLIAATGLIGWMFLMSIAWMLYGIGLKGRDPSWAVKEVVTNQRNLKFAQHEPIAKLAQVKFDPTWCINEAEQKKIVGERVDAEQKKTGKELDANAITVIDSAVGDELGAKAEEARQVFKKQSGWEPMCEGTGQRGDGQATVDATLKKSKSDPLKTPRALFAETSDYQSIGAFRRGGDNQLFTIGRHKMFLRHSPHYFVIMVQPVQKKSVEVPVLTTGRKPVLKDGKPEVNKVEEVVKGADGKPAIDLTKPVTSVVMLRDQGSKRQPPFILFLFSGIALAILASVLHQRDKQLMAAMGKPYKSAKQMLQKD